MKFVEICVCDKKIYSGNITEMLQVFYKFDKTIAKQNKLMYNIIYDYSVKIKL